VLSSDRALAFCLLAVFLPGAASGQLSPPDLGDGWRTSTARSLGLDEAALLGMTTAVRAGEFGNIHAVLIEREQRLVYEAYFTGPDERRGRSVGTVEFDAGTLHDLRSVSKSVLSALIGIAQANGSMPSVQTTIDQLVSTRIETLRGRKGQITLHHLLTMSSGLAWDESLPYSDPRNDERRLDSSDDPVGFVLERDLLSEPGSTWNYSGGSTQVLAELLEQATGQPLTEFARQMLFEPLGIADFEWLGDVAGAPSAASGLRLTPRDLAKFGSLYLNGGRWNGNQVLEPGWVAASTRSHVENPDPRAPPFVIFEGYGYQWWVNSYQTPLGPIDVATASGNGGQRVIVIPSLGLSVTILSGAYNDADYFWTPEHLLIRYIIPAVGPA
jgi:CubicO group peptidase (beta-lactamase class C family)